MQSESVVLINNELCATLCSPYAAGPNSAFLYNIESLDIESLFIPEFERAAKIRKIAVYRFLMSLLVPEL